MHGIKSVLANLASSGGMSKREVLGPARLSGCLPLDHCPSADDNYPFFDPINAKANDPFAPSLIYDVSWISGAQCLFDRASAKSLYLLFVHKQLQARPSAGQS